MARTIGIHELGRGAWPGLCLTSHLTYDIVFEIAMPACDDASTVL